MIVLKVSFLFNPGWFSDSILNFVRVSSSGRGPWYFFWKWPATFDSSRCLCTPHFAQWSMTRGLGWKQGTVAVLSRDNVAPPNENRVEAAYQPFCCLFFFWGGNLQIVGFRGWLKESKATLKLKWRMLFDDFLRAAQGVPVAVSMN